MIRNNLTSMLIHFVLTVTVGFIYVRTAQYCVDYSESVFWIHGGLMILTTALYLAAGALFIKNAGKAWKNLASSMLPMVIGLIIYAADIYVAVYYFAGYRPIIYPIYIMLFTPVLEAVSSFMDYKGMWYLLALAPTMLIWTGLQARIYVSGVHMRRKLRQDV